MIKMLRKEKGITLIALVVTIIVLIILAGVSINLVLGDNGIITKAKEAKQNTELAKGEEEVQLNEAVDYIENIDRIKTVEEMKIAETYMTAKTTLKDSNGNLIVVPEGFKIATDSGINVTDGIVIEDNDIVEGVGNGRGNQYVWIPVGENIKKSDGTEVNITLGRYVFADGTNHKDDKGKVLPKGTPILKQSAENYEDETEISVKELNPLHEKNYKFKELKTNREGIATERVEGENATALDLKGFVDSVRTNGGYYIARYEASYGVDGKANSKVSDTFTNADTEPTTREEGMLWNYILQKDAAVASRNLYEKVTTDLMNSYAWDTAVIYIQNFSKNKEYSYQDAKSINVSLSNTGNLAEGVKDEVCKINDMAANTRGWTTEYSTNTYDSLAETCVGIGGAFSNDYCVKTRDDYFASVMSKNITFRTILYM